jgi:hypothetical protein
MMTTEFDWQQFLEGYNREILATEEFRALLPAHVLASEWLGFPGASSDEIIATEERLKVQLPPSYRSFLATSNGWHVPSWFVYDLWPASKLAWFRDNHQQWIDAYVHPEHSGVTLVLRDHQSPPEPRPLTDEEYLIYGEEQNVCRFRREYLQTAVQISGVGDSAVMLLNPAIITSSGEWEAWVFADWYPGAARFRSFQEMMLHESSAFVQLKNREIKL